MSKQLRIAFRKYGKPVIAYTFRGHWFTPYNTIVLGDPTEKDHICTPGSRNIACAYHICFGVVRSVSSFTRPKRQYIRDREVFPLMSFIHLASVKRGPDCNRTESCTVITNVGITTMHARCEGSGLWKCRFPEFTINLTALLRVAWVRQRGPGMACGFCCC